MNSKTYYEVLGVNRTSTIDEIKKNYRSLAHQYHPDKNHSTGAEAMFIEITEAYEILRDPLKRAEYDIYLNNSESAISIKMEAWEQQARQTAKEYSTMTFSQFWTKVEFELKIAKENTFNIGCFIYLLITAIAVIFLLVSGNHGKTKPAGYVFGPLMILAFAYFGPKLLKSYTNDRKNKLSGK